jgi:hypothetical protein
VHKTYRYPSYDRAIIETGSLIGVRGIIFVLDEVPNPKKIELDHAFFGRLEFITGKNIHNETYEHWSGELATP